MCNIIDNFLPTLKSVPDWFVTIKMITALFIEGDMLFLDEDSGNVTFRSDEMGILRDLNNMNLNNASFYEDDPKTIIHVKVLACHNKYEQHKAFKKDISTELIPVA